MLRVVIIGRIMRKCMAKELGAYMFNFQNKSYEVREIWCNPKTFNSR